MGSLAAEPPPSGHLRPGGRCRVELVMADLDDDDQQVLADWLNTDGYAARSISDKLAQHGHHIAKGTIERHRRRECLCPVEHPDWYHDG